MSKLRQIKENAGEKFHCAQVNTISNKLQSIFVCVRQSEHMSFHLVEPLDSVKLLPS